MLERTQQGERYQPDDRINDREKPLDLEGSQQDKRSDEEDAILKIQAVHLRGGTIVLIIFFC
jgi:hypothetical protein